MIERRHVFLIAGFAAALLFTGIPYWSLPYDANYRARRGLHGCSG